MQASGVNFFTQQIAFQLPTLLAAILGVVLSLIFIGRHRVPALLTLLGSGTAIISALVVAMAQAYIYSLRFSSIEIPPSSYGTLATVISWLGALTKGLAMLLLVIAVFLGRKREPALAAGESTP